MSLPTAQEILSLYLYGQKTPPAELKSESLIRPAGMGATPALVDANEYMTSGGGRFVKVENFNYVRNFLVLFHHQWMAQWAQIHAQVVKAVDQTRGGIHAES